jgi:hypothetical protein
MRSPPRGQCPIAKGTDEFDVKELEMSREAAKKIIDLMVKQGAEQNASSPRYDPFARMMSFGATNE